MEPIFFEVQLCIKISGFPESHVGNRTPALRTRSEEVYGPEIPLEIGDKAQAAQPLDHARGEVVWPRVGEPANTKWCRRGQDAQQGSPRHSNSKGGDKGGLARPYRHA